MNNLALYRKYRPQTFTDVYGQDTITRILKNQIKTDRIGHAYLFSGIRGTGKTTIAKVFAKAVNCENPQDGNPCGVCKICKALNDNSTMDIIEIDAASNRGVDEIRDLKETISYPPTVAHYKVYIIDEVHMLTNEAFNALLKTLEEPPEHAIFLLATTEPEKLPATILSRCQKYNVKPIPDSTIIERMQEICNQEGVKIEPSALVEIANRAGHSMRDALSILDQCVDLEPKGTLITTKEVDDFLGVSPKEEIIEIARAQSQKDGVKLLTLLNDLRNLGREDRLLIEDLSEFYKLLLYYKITNQTDSRYEEVFKEIGPKISFKELYHIIDLLLETHTKLRFNNLSQIITDTALLNLCTLEEPKEEIVQRPVEKDNISKQTYEEPEPYFPDEPESFEEPSFVPVKEESKKVSKSPEIPRVETHINSPVDMKQFKANIIRLAHEKGQKLLSTLLEKSEYIFNKNGLFILIEEKHKFMFETSDFQQRLQSLVNEAMGHETRVYPKIKEQYYAFLNQRKAQTKKTSIPEPSPKTLEQQVKEALGDDNIIYETSN